MFPAETQSTGSSDLPTSPAFEQASFVALTDSPAATASGATAGVYLRAIPTEPGAFQFVPNKGWRVAGATLEMSPMSIATDNATKARKRFPGVSWPNFLIINLQKVGEGMKSESWEIRSRWKLLSKLLWCTWCAKAFRISRMMFME